MRQAIYSNVNNRIRQLKESNSTGYQERQSYLPIIRHSLADIYSIAVMLVNKGLEVGARCADNRDTPPDIAPAAFGLLDGPDS